MVKADIGFRIKRLEAMGLNPSQIASRLNISEEEIYQYHKIRRRKRIIGAAVGLGLVGLAAGATYLINRTPSYKKVAPKIEMVERVPYNDLSERLQADYLALFDKLPKDKQDVILSNLEQFVLTQTNIGKVAGNISQAVRVPAVEVETLEGEALPDLKQDGTLFIVESYDFHSNTIFYRKLPNSYKMHLYLNDVPPPLARAHEHLHFIQDKSSKWDQFETFIYPYQKEAKDKESKLEIPNNKTVLFIGGYLSRESLTVDDANQELDKLIQEYNRKDPARKIIIETQAYLSFAIYPKEVLYKDLLRSRVHASSITGVGKQKFGMVYDATLELNALLGPQNAAEFVGRHGDDIEVYVDKINKLKGGMGIIDAPAVNDKVMNWQMQLAQDYVAIRQAAKNIVISGINAR